VPDLPQRQLGRTGLQVTTLGYGAMELRGTPRGREISEDQSERILNAVLDSGINYIDTSVDYGLSEERIGRYIADRRSEYYLASKCACWALPGEPPPAPNGRTAHVFTAENVRAGVEQSLRRMKTDYLDVVQFHASPSQQQLAENGALDELQELKNEGKVRFLGISGTVPNLAEQIELGAFDVFQIPYSALERDHEELITRASAAGGGTVIRGGAAKGNPGTGEGVYWDRWQNANMDDLLDGASRMEFILRFTCSHPDLDTTIVGTSDPAHLQDNLDAVLKGPLDPELYAEAKRRLEAAGFIPQPA